MEQSQQPFDMSSAVDILTIIFKHKYKILITFLIITIGAIVCLVIETDVRGPIDPSIRLGGSFAARRSR